MGLPQVETCCYIFDLKIGNLILGCLNAVFSFLLMVIMIVVVCTLEPIEHAYTSELKQEDWNAEAAFTGLYAMSIILVLMYLTKFFFDLVFIYGVSNERPNIIRSYMVMWVVFFLLSMFTFFLNASHYNVGAICVELIYISLNVYAILVIYSFYRTLNTREEV